MKVDPIGLQSEIGADAVGQVVNGQFADMVQMSDRRAHGLVQVVKCSSSTEVCSQYIGCVLKSMPRNTALVRVALAVGKSLVAWQF